MNGNTFTKNDYFRKRAQSVGLSLIVMGASFFLYYLGLFGNVQGPLTPGNIGASLAAMGVTKVHMLMFFLSFFIMALTWNHIFNLVSFMIASRLTCMRKNQEGIVCGASTKRIKINYGNKKNIDKNKSVRFKCVNGHNCFDARFNPVKKGVVSHTVWVAALLFCVIIMYG